VEYRGYDLKVSKGDHLQEKFHGYHLEDHLEQAEGQWGREDLSSPIGNERYEQQALIDQTKDVECYRNV
jgi:hypothetical protein